MKKMKKGFTLVELLVVIAIIGVLAAALLIGLNPLEQTRKAQDSGLLSKCKEAIAAGERYYAFHQADPDADAGGNLCPALITADELKADSCDSVDLDGANGDYTCTFTHASQAFEDKCDVAPDVDGLCEVPTDF